ncbi:hypothetical protein PIB30_103468, partial [Stylosanthes scabra]|nr:hypothetical protein [Stylosanthes scabra]
MIIYFHETHFGENSKEIEAQPPWLAYWIGKTIKKRLKQEKKHDVGLLKTGEMKAKKDKLEKKKTTMRAPSSNRDTESESETYQSSSTDSNSESSSSSDSGSDAEPEAKHTIYEEPPPQQEIRSKKKNDRAVVGSNETLIITQQSVAVPGMFDTFETIILGGDDSGNVAVEGPVVVPSHPSHNEKEPIQSEQPSESRVAELEVPPPIVDNVVHEEIQPEPLVVIMPLQPEQQSAGTTEVDPDITNIIPVEPELTLRPWLQPKADT